MEDSIAVRRFAIKYNPPTLVVEYKVGSGLFLKKIKIKSSHSTVRYIYNCGRCFIGLFRILEDYANVSLPNSQMYWVKIKLIPTRLRIAAFHVY
jgi:hypothetical protein